MTWRFHHVSLLLINFSLVSTKIQQYTGNSLLCSLSPHFSSFSPCLKLSCLPPSLSLSLYFALFSVFLSPSHSLSVYFYLHFSFAHFLSLSLSLFLSVSVGLWKTLCLPHEKKCCFTPPVLFSYKIKGNVKYPPDTHTDIHSIYPLLHPLNGLKIEAMQQYEGAEKTGRDREGDRLKENKLV